MVENEKIRLQKLIANAGVASRRHAETMILEGRVKVNGKVITELGTRADPGRDRISVDGHELPRGTDSAAKMTVLLHKPRGVICTADDPEGRKTVFDLLNPSLPRLFSVGRLDYNSEGALLLTNDGDLANTLTHPRHHVAKVYEVRVQGRLSKENLEEIRGGFRLDGQKVRPVEIEEIRVSEKNTWYGVTLMEGRNRQIHRMISHFGLTVSRLRRVQVGPILLGRLALGTWRHLTDDEVATLNTTQETDKNPKDGKRRSRRQRGGERRAK